MNEREVMEYIEQAGRYGIVPGLDNIRELCRRLGDPQKELVFVHIAGTNGKGSLSAYLSSVLKNAGYRVGKYVSPVIYQFREMIQVNDRMITKKALCQGMEEIKNVCDEMTAAGLPHPTPFEMETALGFLYFKEKKCSVVVLETGMGGLLDATNIVENTAVAVLTSISMDHMAFLGNSLGEIAAQKAGVMKPGCRAVSAAQAPEVVEALQSAADERGCPLTAVRSDEITAIKYGLERQRFNYGCYKNLEISLAGRFQVENAALAVEAVEALREKGFCISEAALRNGLKEARWPGRFTVICRKPLFIVDGAHNEDAAKRLAESIEFYFTNKEIIFIMGVLKDKEYEKIIGLTCSFAKHIITVTPPDHRRALPAYELAQAAAKVHGSVTAADSLEEAVEMSGLLAGRDGVIVAFGSLSFLGRLTEAAGSAFGGTVGRPVKK